MVAKQSFGTGRSQVELGDEENEETEFESEVMTILSGWKA
jgi:hypothetical protein